jgi:hypothetical protein
MGAAPDSTRGVHDEYTRRLAARGGEAGIQSRHSAIVSNLRLLVFIAGVIVAWLVFGTRALSPAWLAPPIAIFVVLLVVHDRLLRARARAQRSVAFYERALARLEDRWAGGGEAGERFRDHHHPYSEDLDLMGEGSLFELLCEARTRSGEETLAAWLLGPAVSPVIRLRQGAVRELTDRLDLREDLARLGDDVRAGVDPEVLCAWGAAPTRHTARAPAVIAGGIAALAIGGLVGWIATPAGPLLFAIALLLGAVFSGVYRRRVQAVIEAVELPGRDLGLIACLLERLERESYDSPRLVELRAALDTKGLPPSVCIARLRRLVELLDARRNQLFIPVALILVWTPQLAFAIERWRAVYGEALGKWIAAIGEFEALCAFAGFSYERPDYPFPEIVDEPAGFEAVAMGHPLLPADRCVRNDVKLAGEQQLLIVSGSNMSGKSTLLRTVGTNTVLGLSGAPVCAQHLRLSPLAIGASIRLQDSLQEGSSRFYAEILRLRQIADLSQGDLPTLFLLDEILHGTNSHDRGIGAEAVVSNLLENDAIGLVTTHDLALTRVADALAPRAANVHFQDHLEGGEIAFDYRMHDGVVTKSNALELMRAVGLQV